MFSPSLLHDKYNMKCMEFEQCIMIAENMGKETRILVYVHIKYSEYSIKVNFE